jgi:hypothetical protein
MWILWAILSVLVIATATAGLLLIVIYDLLWKGNDWFATEPGSDPPTPATQAEGEDPPPPVMPSERRNVFEGTMERSLRLKGVVCRYQRRSRAHRGNDFWRVFEDGPWKWSAKGRYAGEDVNPGHYFAFLPSSAKAEISHYLGNDGDLSSYDLLRVKGDLDNILDLTYWENVSFIATKNFGYAHVKTFLVEVITPQTGGNKTDEWIGYYASRAGYNGAVYYSARAIREGDRELLENAGYAYYELLLPNIRANVEGQCLVLFSGAVVLSAISEYCYNDDEWEPNPYYGWTQDRLDEVFEYKSDYQEAKRSRVHYTSPTEPDKPLE